VPTLVIGLSIKEVENMLVHCPSWCVIHCLEGFWRDTIETGCLPPFFSLVDYDYKVGQKVLLWNKGVLCKAESRSQKEPWMITSVHTNGTITAQCGNKLERMNIRRI
jgi:hypothetical protein